MGQWECHSTCKSVVAGFLGLGRSFLAVAWPTGVHMEFFFYSRFSLMLLGDQGSPFAGQLIVCETSLLIHYGVYYDLFV